MYEVIVAIGSNLYERHQYMLNAQAAILDLPKSTDFHFSSIYQTVPIGCTSDSPIYLNAVVKFNTNLQPYELLELVQDIEQANDRERPYLNAPRTLDLDVILFADQISSDPKLTIPHPRMHERFFVLTPLCEIAPDLVHPILKKTICELEASLKDKDKLIQLSTEQFASNFSPKL